MRVADYVMTFLEKLGVGHVFMLSGGGIMYLVDALGRSGMHHVCCHHEQAAGIAAQAYAMARNSLGVCMATTGPGGTNALTAAGAAYMDSTTMLFLTGQVKTADFASLRDVRQFGAQENDIISMARPVTKYAVTVIRADGIRYHLEKAVYLATHGRRGPAWLDIPLDIQNAQIDPEGLVGFCPEEAAPDDNELAKAVGVTCGLIKNAKRPLLLIGHGVVASGAEELFGEVQAVLKMPVESTWRALGIMDYDDPYFFGSPGLQANRYSNLILQGADLLIVLGSRLDNMITAFDEGHFAYRARKVVVDVDANEICKLRMDGVTAAVCDAAAFLRRLKEQVCGMDIPDYTEWLSFCNAMRGRYPLLHEKQEQESGMVDLYQLTMRLSEHCKKEDAIVVTSTSRCNTAGHIAFKHRKGQRLVSSMGFGSMGFALPSAIGCWFAGAGRRVVMLEGDGSLQLNIQELQTIVHHNMNVKMFIFRNEGYAAIATMQDRNFDGLHVGCDGASGVTMPDLGKVAAAYGLPYCRITRNEEIEEKIQETLGFDGPAVCEFIGSITYDEIPKCISYLDGTGARVSAKLENPFPFLPEQEMEEIYGMLFGKMQEGMA